MAVEMPGTRAHNAALRSLALKSQSVPLGGRVHNEVIRTEGESDAQGRVTVGGKPRGPFVGSRAYMRRMHELGGGGSTEPAVGPPVNTSLPILSIYQRMMAPDVYPENDITSPTAFMLGNRLTVLAAGRITGIIFWQEGGTTPRYAALWSDTGTLLADATVPNGVDGWNKALFAAPVNVTAGQVVRASYGYEGSGVGGAYSFDAYEPNPICSNLEWASGVLSDPNPAHPFPNNIDTKNYYADVIFLPTVPSDEGVIATTDGVWQSASPISATLYRWLRNGLETGVEDREIVPAWWGNGNYTSRLLKTNADGESLPADSAPLLVGTMPAMPVCTALPRIQDGGNRLIGLSGTWTPLSIDQFERQWWENGVMVLDYGDLWNPTPGKTYVYKEIAHNAAGTVAASSLPFVKP